MPYLDGTAAVLALHSGTVEAPRRPAPNAMPLRLLMPAPGKRCAAKGMWAGTSIGSTWSATPGAAGSGRSGPKSRDAVAGGKQHREGYRVQPKSGGAHDPSRSPRWHQAAAFDLARTGREGRTHSMHIVQEHLPRTPHTWVHTRLHGWAQRTPRGEGEKRRLRNVSVCPWTVGDARHVLPSFRASSPKGAAEDCFDNCPAGRAVPKAWK